MTRNSDNAQIWSDAAVRVSASATRPPLPTDINTAFLESDWPEVGILDGNAGITEDRTSAETKHFGWGIGLIKIGAKNFELARKFSPLEDNVTVRDLVFPGSTTNKIYMPKPVYRWIAFENTSDLGIKERVFSIRRGRFWVPANTRNESDLTKWEVQVALFADGNNAVFDRQVTIVGIPNQLVTIPAGTTSGTFTFSIGGQTTTAIAFNATAATVQAALAALSTVGAGNVTVTGNAGGPFTVTFATTVTGTLTASGAGLTPVGTVTVANA